MSIKYATLTLVLATTVANCMLLPPQFIFGNRNFHEEDFEDGEGTKDDIYTALSKLYSSLKRSPEIQDFSNPLTRHMRDQTKAKNRPNKAKEVEDPTMNLRVMRSDKSMPVMRGDPSMNLRVMRSDPDLMNVRVMRQDPTMNVRVMRNDPTMNVRVMRSIEEPHHFRALRSNPNMGIRVMRSDKKPADYMNLRVMRGDPTMALRVM